MNPQTKHRAFGAQLKAADKASGTIEAIVSVFGNVDAAKERVVPGAFAKSIARKLPKGVWAHDWTQPVAKTIEALELLPGDALLPDPLKDNGGLYIKAQFNLDTQRGKDAFSDIAFGTIDEFSFGYAVLDSEKATDGAVDLKEIEIFEWSPVLVGCNPATALISAKSRAGVKSVLAEYLPRRMTMGAVDSAQNALYWFLYDVLSDWGDWATATTEQRLAAVQEACAEFSEAVIAVVAALQAGDAEDPADDAEETMSIAKRNALATIKTLWREEHPRLAKSSETKGMPPALAAARNSLAAHEAALAGLAI